MSLSIENENLYIYEKLHIKFKLYYKLNRKNKSDRKLIFGYSTIGVQLAVTLLLFVYGGYRLDNYYKTTPLFVIMGTIIGMIVGFYNLLQGIKQIEESTKREKEEVNNTKSKWL